MHHGVLRIVLKQDFGVKLLYYPHPNFIYQLLVGVIIAKIWIASSSPRCMVAMGKYVVNFVPEHGKHAVGQNFDVN